MSDLVVPNIICFQTQKQLTTFIRVLLKSVLIDLRARDFVHAAILIVSLNDIKFIN